MEKVADLNHTISGQARRRYNVVLDKIGQFSCVQPREFMRIRRINRVFFVFYLRLFVIISTTCDDNQGCVINLDDM